MRRLLPLLALGALCAAAPVHAASTTTTEAALVTAGAPGTFSYSVGGWGGGGTVSGTFTGTDSDADSQLSSFDGEVTGFTMSYSGGTIVGAFSLGLAELFGLVYDLDGGVLGDGLTLDIEGIGASDGVSRAFLLGPGPVAQCDGSTACGELFGPDATGVPEPAALALALVSLGLMAAFRRRTS